LHRPERLETEDEIALAMRRERLFALRSLREICVQNDRLGLLERKVNLALLATGAILTMVVMTIAVAVYPPASVAVGGIGLGGVVRALRQSSRHDRQSTAGHPWIYHCAMPLYEFACEDCGGRFEELAPSTAQSLVCPDCGSKRTRRLLSPVAPSGRQPRGAGVRSDESRRRDREAARGERLADAKRKRAAGEAPSGRGGRGAA
jgi:putative FmdB family regulatory protein